MLKYRNYVRFLGKGFRVLDLGLEFVSNRKRKRKRKRREDKRREEKKRKEKRREGKGRGEKRRGKEKRRKAQSWSKNNILTKAAV